MGELATSVALRRRCSVRRQPALLLSGGPFPRPHVSAPLRHKLRSSRGRAMVRRRPAAGVRNAASPAKSTARNRLNVARRRSATCPTVGVPSSGARIVPLRRRRPLPAGAARRVPDVCTVAASSVGHSGGCQGTPSTRSISPKQPWSCTLINQVQEQLGLQVGSRIHPICWFSLI